MDSPVSPSSPSAPSPAPSPVSYEDMTHEELIGLLKGDKEKLKNTNKELKMQLRDLKKNWMREQTGLALKEKVIKETQIAEIQAQKDQFFELKERLPKINILNIRKSEKVNFYEQIPVRYIQYPDNATLATKTNQEVQPIRLGLFGGFHQYSVIAQFGNLPEFKVGYNKDDERLKLQFEIDQYSTENRIYKIAYQREKYFPFYERFRFFSKDGEELGCIGKVFKNSQGEVRAQDNIVVNKKVQSLFGPVVEDDFLIAIKVGINQWGGVADLQFIYHKRT